MTLFLSLLLWGKNTHVQVYLLCRAGINCFLQLEFLFKVLLLYPAYPIELCHLSRFNHIISFAVMHVTEDLLWWSNYMFQKKIELPCHWVFNKTQSCSIILGLRFPQPIDIAVNSSTGKFTPHLHQTRNNNAE